MKSKWVSRNGKKYSVVNETDTEVCVLVIMDYYDRGRQAIECWWDKKYLDTEEPCITSSETLLADTTS